MWFFDPKYVIFMWSKLPKYVVKNAKYVISKISQIACFSRKVGYFMILKCKNVIIENTHHSKPHKIDKELHLHPFFFSKP